MYRPDVSLQLKYKLTERLGNVVPEVLLGHSPADCPQQQTFTAAVQTLP